MELTELAQERVALTATLTAVITALWFEIDHGDGTQASGFFTPEAELRFFTRSFHGTTEIDAVYAARTGRGPRVSRHLTTNVHLTEVGDDADTATAVSNLLLYADDGEPPRPTVTPSLIADVIDDFERHDGRWLIRRRHIQQMFAPPDATLAVPTE